jgi:autotransporter-associated beta strand protein
VINGSTSAASIFVALHNTDVFSGSIADGPGGGPLTIGTYNSGSLMLNGVLSNSGGISAAGGVITLANNNTFTGGVGIGDANIQIANPGALNALTPNAVNFSVSSTGALILKGNSITVSGLSSVYVTLANASVLNGSSTPATFTVVSANDSSYGGFLEDGGTGALSIVKKGAGTLTFDGNWSYSGATMIDSGTLRLALNSRVDAYGPVAPVTVASGATLELAGPTSDLSSDTVRVNVMNNSKSPGILVSGTHQQVGNIDGSGTTQINAGGDLTANQIIQSALVIGGVAGSSAIVTIDASDASGNPLARLAVLTASIPNAPLSSGADVTDPLSYATTGDPLAASPPLVSGVQPAAVPEPSSLFLLAVGGPVVAITAFRRRRLE